MKNVSLAVVVALQVASCDADPAPARQACPSFVSASLLEAGATSQLVVVGVSPRFDSGRVRSLSLSDLTFRPLAIEATGDTVLRPMGPVLALLHRALGNQDNLTLFDPRTGAVCQVSLVTDAEARASRSRPYANAHDAIAVDASHLYVARHNMPSLAVVDLDVGVVTRTIDLAPYQGGAPLPYPDAMARVNGEVWVTLERDDDPSRQNPMQNGIIVRVDPRSGAVSGTINLLHPNPYGPLQASPDGRERWVATFGSYGRTGDGAVEAVDVATRAVRSVVSETEVMGNIDAFAIIDDHRLVLRVSAERVGTAAIDSLRIMLFDTATRVATPLWQMTQWGAAAPVVVGDRIFVSDPGTGTYHAGAGVRVFSIDGTMSRAAPIAMDPGLMPYDAQPMR